MTTADVNTNVSNATKPPVTILRVEQCLSSASYWANNLPLYANNLQRRADSWSTAAGLLGAVTGLAIWPLLVNSDSIWSRVAISVIALASAGCALVPRIKSYGEMAGQARELAARYGPLVGSLIDAKKWMVENTAVDGVVRSIVADFESVKASKDSLRSLPVRETETREFNDYVNGAGLRGTSTRHDPLGPTETSTHRSGPPSPGQLSSSRGSTTHFERHCPRCACAFPIAAAAGSSTNGSVRLDG